MRLFDAFGHNRYPILTGVSKIEAHHACLDHLRETIGEFANQLHEEIEGDLVLWVDDENDIWAAIVEHAPENIQYTRTKIAIAPGAWMPRSVSDKQREQASQN